MALKLIGRSKLRMVPIFSRRVPGQRCQKSTSMSPQTKATPNGISSLRVTVFSFTSAAGSR